MSRGQILNGTFIEGPTIAIDPLEPCFAHGHGLFETLRVADGRAIFLAGHVERLQRAAASLDLECKVDVTTAHRCVSELLAKLGLTQARVKIHLLGLASGKTDVLFTAEEVPAVRDIGEQVVLGLAAPRFRVHTPLLGLKTMNYMFNRLAEKEGRTQGFDEVVLTTADGVVTEGSKSSLFFVEGGRLFTPSLKLPILPGITRSAIVELARVEGIDLEEGFYAFERLQHADEAFLTGSFSGIRPVAKAEEVNLGSCPGEITLRLANAYRRRIALEPLLSASPEEG